MAPTVMAQSLNCDMTQYKAASGLTAAIEQDALAVTWTGCERIGTARALWHRQRAAGRSGAGGEEERRAVGAARAESVARVLRQDAACAA